MRTKLLLASAAASATACLLAGCAVTDPDSVTPLAGHPALDLYAGFHADYIEFETPAELGDFAELAISGEIERVDAGRTWGFLDDDLPDTESVVVSVSNVRVVGGTDRTPPASIVYVELHNIAGAPLSEFQAALPAGAPVVFYLSAGAEEGDAPDLQNPEAGRPMGEPIYVPVGPQGFAIEVPEQHAVAWPLASHMEAGEISDAVPGGTMLPD